MIELKDLPKTLECPYCDGVSGLIEVDEQFLSSRISNKRYYLYKCNKCDEGFTTTNSDTVSMQLNQTHLIETHGK